MWLKVQQTAALLEARSVKPPQHFTDRRTRVVQFHQMLVVNNNLNEAADGAFLGAENPFRAKLLRKFN